MSKVLSFTFLFLLFAVLFSGCEETSESTADREKVFLDDSKGDKNNEVAIEETAVKNAEAQGLTDRSRQPDSEETEADGTKVSTMYDGFGNKTERRFFFQHSTLEAMVLRTSVSGEKEVLVFGHNGEVKNVPQNMVEKAMFATPDDLARAAGITEGRRTPSINFSGYSQQQKDAALTAPTVPDFSMNPLAEPEAAETKPTENREPEQPKNKNITPNVKLAETQYQSALNKIILNGKKPQTAKNDDER